MGEPGLLEQVGAFYFTFVFLVACLIAGFILYHSSRKARKLLDHYLIKGDAWGDNDE